MLPIVLLGVLRNDKIQLTALLKSKDANIIHLKDGHCKLEQDKHKLEAAIEGLKYDLNSSSKLKQDTVKSMKTKIEELELQLQQSRSEAEIYYKGIVEQNLNAAQVNSKVRFCLCFLYFSTGGNDDEVCHIFQANVTQILWCSTG